MARRYAMNPDFLQSVPPKSRATARESAKGMQAQPSERKGAESPANARTTPRQHWARVLGAATLASLLIFFLAVTPEKPALSETRANPETKSVAQGLNSVHTPIHALHEAARNRNPHHANDRATNPPKRTNPA